MFVLLGAIFSVIFDFFRALRKVKKPKNFTVYIQDIIYFCIIGAILIVTMINYTKESFRLYLLLSIVLGVFIYIGVFGNMIFNIFQNIIKASNEIVEFIFITLELPKQLFKKQMWFIKKIVKNCCKKIYNMVNFKYSKLKKVNICKIFVNKRGIINGKKRFKKITKKI